MGKTSPFSPTVKNLTFRTIVKAKRYDIYKNKTKILSLMIAHITRKKLKKVFYLNLSVKISNI